MASGSSRGHVDQFFAAKKRRPSSRKDEPSSSNGSPGAAKGSLAGYLVRSPPAAAAASSVAPARSPGVGDAGARRSLSAAMNADNSATAMNLDVDNSAGRGDDAEMKRFTMEFLSHYCSAIPPVVPDSAKAEPDKKQHKRSADHLFLVPCDDRSVKKQCVPKVKDLVDNMPVANHGGSESLQELGQGAKASGEGLAAVQRCSFTPNTAQKKVGFSGETPKSASSLVSPGEDFWNAAMEFADGVSAMADKGPKRAHCIVAEDKSSCPVALGSKTLPRSGNEDGFNCENTVGSNPMKEIDKFSNTVELASANRQHENNSPLPVKHLNFFHEDEIQVSGLEGKAKVGTVPGSVQVNQGRLMESSFHRTENLMHCVDDMKRVTSDPDTDSPAKHGKEADLSLLPSSSVFLDFTSLSCLCLQIPSQSPPFRHIAKYLKVASGCSKEVGSEFRDAASAVEALKRCPAGLDPVLEETIPFGVAYHHAGLTVEERDIVETCYRKGLVRVLTATSTLAAGVNLPARRVIFRQPKIGRDFIDGTRYRQMAGRAGRTGIDTKGESILVCRPEEVKRITGIVKSDCPALQSCLSEDKNGMTHAIMEVVAGGIVQTASDIHRYVRCTLLNSTKPFDDVVKSAQDSLRWLCHKRFVEWNNETKIYSATPLGRASFGSSLNPEESLAVLDDLSRAREGFVLASDLHLVYLVTPINVEVEPDWELYYERFMQLSTLEQSVGNRVGVIEPFLMHMAHGGAMPIRGRPKRNTSGGSGGNTLINNQSLRVSKRFYVALMISRLAQEVPVTDVCESFKVARGTIQGLQENAGRFASMVSAFCQRLGWHDLEGLVAKFQNRVSFGVRAEIAELTSIPFVKGSRARALYNSGLRTPVTIAEASIPEIAKAIFESTWSGQDDHGLRRVQFGIAKKIKNGARRIVLEEAEAARVAAFSAFRSLGVEVPQFTTPLLPASEDSPPRDVMVSSVGDHAKCHKSALGTHIGDGRNICSNYVAQRDSTEIVRADMHPVFSIQIKESEGIADSVNIATMQEGASPLSTVDKSQSRNASDKGPVNACNFPGGFDSFLDQWSSVNDFSFDLHFVRRSTKLTLNVFEILGLAVCWENSPIYYCNFPKDLTPSGNKESIEMWEEFKRRWSRITGIMQAKSVKKMTWNLKIQIQALKSPCVSGQRLSRLHLDHKSLNNIDVLDSTYVLLPPISVYNGLDICLVAWILWPDEESKTAPNLEKLVKKRLHSEAIAAANRDGRWRNQMHKAAHNGCCRRAAQTRALSSALRKLLVSEKLNDLVETVEGPLVNVLADMELWGIGADMDACLRARHIIIKKLKDLEKEAYKLVGKSFSLNANADIADILFTHLKLPVPKGCEKGKLHPSTDKQCLDHLSEFVNRIRLRH
uniref:Uncharacterized protein n=1 Tax=Avena sativa TaxID=4498 RepID=A0ACD5XMT5_AVESA